MLKAHKALTYVAERCSPEYAGGGTAEMERLCCEALAELNRMKPCWFSHDYVRDCEPLRALFELMGVPAAEGYNVYIFPNKTKGEECAS